MGETTMSKLNLIDPLVQFSFIPCLMSNSAKIGIIIEMLITKSMSGAILMTLEQEQQL